MPKLFDRYILQRYIVREWFLTFLPSLGCFEFLIFLGFAIQLLHKGLDIVSLRALIPHLFIQALPYSIPPALLAATAITYGRMSADHEILAIQTSGIHIRTVATPILVMGLIFSFITTILSSEILPRSCYKIMLLQERAINNVLTGKLMNFQKKIDIYPYQIYIGSVEGNVNKNIVVIEYADEYIINVTLAEEGTIAYNESEKKILVTLYRGEFIKPNYKKLEEIPRTGVFNEFNFEISLNEKKRETSTKYMTAIQLIKNNWILDREIAQSIERLSDSKKYKDRGGVRNEYVGYQKELDELSGKQEKLLLELKRSEENIKRQKSKIEGLENEARIARNFILVTNENLIQAKKEQKKGTSVNNDIDKKIMQIKETIEREKQRIYSIEQRIEKARKVQNEESENISASSQAVAELNKRRDDLVKTIATSKEELSIAEKKSTIRKNDISLHKRLSQSLSCLAFIVIGIPLGIKLRSGNLMVGFGASFLVILFIHYPLVVTGIVMAENNLFPVVPVLWAADIILFMGGIFVFRKIFIQ
ncbi:MAG TPA: LptF/LptG family permease [Candidatus Brocadiaceae bacterium]